MNTLIQTNLNHLNLYNKKDIEFLANKAFAYYDYTFEENIQYDLERIPYCSGISYTHEDDILFQDIDIFNKWRAKNNNWDYTKHFFEDLFKKGILIDIKKLLQELSPFITKGNRKNIQNTYNKYLLNIQNKNSDPITLEDISTFGNLFLITLISVQNKSLEHVLKLLNEYCVENHKITN